MLLDIKRASPNPNVSSPQMIHHRMQIIIIISTSANRYTNLDNKSDEIDNIETNQIMAVFREGAILGSTPLQNAFIHFFTFTRVPIYFCIKSSSKLKIKKKIYMCVVL